MTVTIIGFGCILSYRSLRLYSNLSETVQVGKFQQKSDFRYVDLLASYFFVINHLILGAGFCWYNIAISGIVTTVAINLIDIDQESQIIAQAIGVFWATFFCSVCFVLPLLLPASVQSNERTIILSSTSLNNRQPITKPVLDSDVSDILSRFDNKTKSGILETIVEKNDLPEDNVSLIFTSSQQEDCKEEEKNLDNE